MSGLLGRLFKLGPPPPPPPSPAVQRWIADYAAQIEAKVQNELSNIAACGLPPPLPYSPLTDNAPPTFDELIINLPKFRLPLYKAFPVEELPILREDRVIFGLDSEVCYCLVRDNQEQLAQAQAVREESGMYALIQHAPDGVFCTRDPYGLFEQWNRHGPEKPNDLLSHPERWQWPAVQRLHREPVLAVLKQLPERVTFFRATVEGIFGLGDNESGSSYQEGVFIDRFKKYTDFRKPVPHWLFQTIMPRLELPEPQLPPYEECTSVKVFPNSPVSARQAIAFLGMIKTVSQPVRFHIVQEQGTVYFALTCHDSDAETVQRQLQLHFPTFTTAHVIDPAVYWMALEGVINSFSIRLRPAWTYEFLQPLTAFHVDPYMQLMSVLDQFSENLTRLEFTFAPVNPGAIATMAEMLQAWGKNWGKDEAGRRGKLLQQKLPAWLLQIKLVTEEVDHIQRLLDTFLLPIATYEQPYDLAKKGEETHLHWNVVSTEELASFVHFPNFEM